jgi:hypothetical protein
MFEFYLVPGLLVTVNPDDKDCLKLLKLGYAIKLLYLDPEAKEDLDYLVDVYKNFTYIDKEDIYFTNAMTLANKTLNRVYVEGRTM